MNFDILGILPFLHGLYQRYTGLQMTVSDVDVAYKDNEIYLVLFHLVLENNSSLGRTVYDIQVGREEGVSPQVISCQYAKGHHIVRYLQPNCHGLILPIPYDEILQPPLGIPPHQPMIGWWVSLLISDKNSKGDSYDVDLVAYGKGDKHMASCRALVRREIGFYPNPHKHSS